MFLRRVWRYQRGNQNTHIDEEQTTQWPKEKSTKGDSISDCLVTEPVNFMLFIVCILVFFSGEKNPESWSLYGIFVFR
jgi:hypothetical protein